MSRRTFNPGSIHVYVWYAASSSLTKCIWQSAISQHQFYLDRKQARLRGGAGLRTLKEIARDLTRSSASLSSASSTSNVSLNGSAASLAHNNHHVGDLDGELAEEARRARQEMVAALKARREALEEKLKEKKVLLKELCLKEGELTGKYFVSLRLEKLSCFVCQASSHLRFLWRPVNHCQLSGKESAQSSSSVRNSSLK